MKEETYEYICQLHHTLLEEESVLSQNFQKHSELYWKLSGKLPQEQWQIVNNCFCSFHKFYMAVLTLALNDTP